MSIIKKIRGRSKPARRAAAKPAQDNSKVTRRVYASLRENIQQAITETLKQHKNLISANFRSRTSFADWADLVVGDAVTDTAEEVYTDLPDIAEVMVEEPPKAEEEEEPKAEEEEPEDETETEPEAEGDEPPMPTAEEEEEEPKPEEELEEVASELEEIKSRALAQAKRLAKAGAVDEAARLKVICDRL